MRLLPLVLLPLFIAACNGLNSSFSNRTGDGLPEIDEKPTACKMDFSQTCWSKTVETITSCIRNGGTDLFSADGNFCSNATSKKLIHFQSVTDMFARPMDFLHATPGVNFKVYPDSVNECFSVSGNGDKFSIRLKKTGETVNFKFDKKEMAFNCLDGQEVRISADKINGCENVMGGEFAEQVPGLLFEPIVDQGKELGWVFRFRGAADSPDVFRCMYPQ